MYITLYDLHITDTGVDTTALRCYTEYMTKPVDIIFPGAYARKQMRMCPFCDNAISIGDFRNPISLREYEISGLCQQCQDDVFGVD